MRRFLYVLLLSVLGVIAYHSLTHDQVAGITTQPQDMHTPYDIEIGFQLAGPGETYLPSCIRPPEVMP